MQKSDKIHFLLVSFWTVSLASIGFMLLHFSFVGYGETLFILIPLFIGFFLGKAPNWKSTSFFSLLIGLVAFFFLLISAQMEGFMCIIMLLPLVFALTFVGSVFGWMIRKKMEEKKVKKRNLKLTIYPILIILFSAIIDHYFIGTNDYNKVESKIFLPYSKETVFDYIKSVDTLNTEKPLLLKLGLSVPQKCILEKEDTGAKRTCYFEEGTIEEKVTEIKRGEILKMDVVKYGLPGLKWLKFDEAIYLFKAENNGTGLTRITTYTTELKPRFYWKFWEVKAIEAEHEYVLNDLKQRLDNSFHQEH